MSDDDLTRPAPHAFESRPHRTLLALAVPVLFSLIVEPLMGLVDTAYVARLGATEVAALGVSTTLLSGASWVFNFLGIGTQTHVGRELGAGSLIGASKRVSLAVSLAGVLGSAIAVIAWPWTGVAAAAMGAGDAIQSAAVEYLRVRLLGVPAMLITFSAFGALRGLQDMRTPLRVALGANLINAVLDPLLIFGPGPLPALGVAG
jgi:MATE family multidrug resistance protein